MQSIYSYFFENEIPNDIKEKVLKIQTIDDMREILKYSRKLSDYKPGLVIDVYDKMQKNYSYTLTEPYGKNFDPEFKPVYSPDEMLHMGIFEGKYLNDCLLEFPKIWYLPILTKLSPMKPDVTKNAYGVKSRQGLSKWRENGWIKHPDVRGWFQWYCRYYIGRRIPSMDKWQIKRWKHNIAHLGALKKQCPGEKFTDKKCGLVRKQLLLQWSYPQK